MKRFWIGLAFGVIAFALLRTPKYWRVFQRDTNIYGADTFYYIIKEEYREDGQGKRLYQQPFTDIQDGDILVTDSTYCLSFRHGHAALVVDAKKGITLEAFGLGTESEYSGLNDWRRYPHVLVLRLNAPERVRDMVVQYARERLVGIPYMLSPGVVDDKDMDGTYWGTQCAHLVWVAFSACGYDIDSNKGWLVLPEDFIGSELLRWVPQGEKKIEK